MECAKKEKLTTITDAYETCDSMIKNVKKALHSAELLLPLVKPVCDLIARCDNLMVRHFMFLQSDNRTISDYLFNPVEQRVRQSEKETNDFEKELRQIDESLKDNLKHLGKYKEELGKKFYLAQRADSLDRLSQITLHTPEWIDEIPFWKPNELWLQWKEMKLDKVIRECEKELRFVVGGDISEFKN